MKEPTVPQKPCGLVIENRKKAVLTGVKEVDRFDETAVVLETWGGRLTLTGSGLHVSALQLEEGKLLVDGDIDGVHKVRVYGRIGQMALEYDEQCRAGVLDALGALDAQAIADAKTGYVMQLEPRKHKLVMDLATLIGAHYARRWFLPTPLRAVFVVAGYMTFLRAALHELSLIHI